MEIIANPFHSHSPSNSNHPIPLIIFVVVTSSFLTAAHGLSIFRRNNNHKIRMESIVRQYFDGVNQKDPQLIRSCFGMEATIHDICVSDTKKTVPAQVLTDRCMDFLTAHPDCRVEFHYGPECGWNSNWVVAHWYEVGTWSGESCGLQPTFSPMKCQGQTRFLVQHNVIVELVVTRTVTDWETELLLEKQKIQ